MKRLALSSLIALALLAPALVLPVSAASTPTNALREVDDLPTVALSPYADWFWHRPDNAFVFGTPTGDIGVATLVKEEGRQLHVVTYDGETFAQKGSPVTVTFPEGWTQWGGITQLDDGSFLVLNGRKNPDEVVGRETFAVRRYSASWSAGPVAYLKSGSFKADTDVYTPFDGVKPAMAVVGDRLVVHTARTRFESGDHDHHQTSLTFEVDLVTMKVTRFDAFGSEAAPVASHSFSQQAAMNGDGLVLVDHGDTNPRAVQVSVVPGYPEQRKATSYESLKIAGDDGLNITGLSVTGLVSGPEGVVVLGNSVRQDDKVWDPEHEKRNLYALHVDPATGAKKFTWLTSLAPQGSSQAGEPRVVQVSDDRFAVLSDVATGSGHRTEYRLIDSAGTVLATKTFDATFFSGISQPVTIDQRVYWVNKTASDQEYSAWLYGLDVSDPADPSFVSERRSFPQTPRPVVSGEARVGMALTASSGDWGTPVPPTFSYQWKADGSAVAGATRSTFTPAAAQVGRRITVVITAMQAGYASTSKGSSRTAAVAPGRLTSSVPAIEGAARVGSVLTARPGSWGPQGLVLSYRWFAGGQAISGATKARLRLTAGQKGKTVTVRVTGRRAGYTSVTKVSSGTRRVR